MPSSSLQRLSFATLLTLKTKTINQTKQLHANLITNGNKSSSLFSKLVQHYCSQHSFNHAHQIVSTFPYPNLFLFNTLIRCTHFSASFPLFANRVSKSDLVFDESTFVFVLGACARSCSIRSFWEGTQIHTLVIKNGFIVYLLVGTTLIHFYSRSKEILLARQVFDEMIVRSSVTWNSMISGYCSQTEKNSCEYACAALALFKEMLVDDCPNDTTIVCVLSAISQLGVLESGVCVHGYVEKTVFLPENDVFIGTALIDMYSKCGLLASGLSLFARMSERNVLTWTAMTSGLAIHGKGKEAIELLDTMNVHGVKPNSATFTSLISACCHSGLVDEGVAMFNKMESQFGILPNTQHYGCLVDLLGKFGLLREAYEFINSLSVKADAILWRSLLSACKVHGDVEMGEKVGNLLLREAGFSDSIDKSQDYVALSNVYASIGKWEDVEMVREVMKVKGLETKHGCSLVQSFGNLISDKLYEICQESNEL